MGMWVLFSAGTARTVGFGRQASVINVPLMWLLPLAIMVLALSRSITKNAEH